jgi:F-type H+-transporting ATPase subunit alpha
LIEHGKRVTELFKQKQYNQFPVEEQVVQLWAAQQGFFNSLPVESIQETRIKLIDFVKAKRPDLLSEIKQQKKLTDEIKDGLKAVAEEYRNRV